MTVENRDLNFDVCRLVHLLGDNPPDVGQHEPAGRLWCWHGGAEAVDVVYRR